MPYKILIVDDEKDVVETLKNRLIREEYEVVTAYDGEEALVKFKNEAPDIVLLDLMLPKLDGHEVLKEIRKDSKRKWCPVIMMSARHEVDMVQKSYALEADHYLTKPYTIENVLRGIKTMISLMPLRKEN